MSSGAEQRSGASSAGSGHHTAAINNRAPIGVAGSQMHSLCTCVGRES